MAKEKSVLNIKFTGDTFQNINGIIDDETERLKTVLIAYSKMADVYTEVFKCNPNIILKSRKIFGDIIIDDNHVQILWNVFGHEIEFYFEQYWGIIELNIDTKESDIIISEIVKAFEHYYNKKLKYSVEALSYKDEVIFNLCICDK